MRSVRFRFPYAIREQLVAHGKRDKKKEFEHKLLKYTCHAMEQIMRHQYEIAEQGKVISVEFLRAMSYSIWKDMREGRAKNIFDRLALQNAADAMIAFKKLPI